MKQILEAMGILNQKTEKVFCGKADETLRLEAKKGKEEISKLETELAEKMAKNAATLIAEHQEHLTPLLKEHRSNWERIIASLGLEQNNEYSINIMTGQVFQIVKTPKTDTQSDAGDTRPQSGAGSPIRVNQNEA